MDASDPETSEREWDFGDGWRIHATFRVVRGMELATPHAVEVVGPDALISVSGRNALLRAHMIAVTMRKVRIPE